MPKRQRPSDPHEALSQGLTVAIKWTAICRARASLVDTQQWSDDLDELLRLLATLQRGVMRRQGRQFLRTRPAGSKKPVGTDGLLDPVVYVSDLLRAASVPADG